MTYKCESANLTFILIDFKYKSMELESPMSNHSTQLFHYIVRLSKEDSAFFYFQLEANDGICFYSTLPHTPHDQFRDIDLKGDVLLKNEMDHILKVCGAKFSIEILVNELIDDKKDKAKL
jgi:hypothetical protein